MIVILIPPQQVVLIYLKFTQRSNEITYPHINSPFIKLFKKMNYLLNNHRKDFRVWSLTITNHFIFNDFHSLFLNDFNCPKKPRL